MNTTTEITARAIAEKAAYVVGVMRDFNKIQSNLSSFEYAIIDIIEKSAADTSENQIIIQYEPKKGFYTTDESGKSDDFKTVCVLTEFERNYYGGQTDDDFVQTDDYWREREEEYYSSQVMDFASRKFESWIHALGLEIYYDDEKQNCELTDELKNKQLAYDFESERDGNWADFEFYYGCRC